MGRFTKYGFIAILVFASLSLSLLILYSSELRANSKDKAKVVWTATSPQAMVDALMAADSSAATTLSPILGETLEGGVVNKKLEVRAFNIKKTTGEDRATIKKKISAQRLARFVNDIKEAKGKGETTILRKRILGSKKGEPKFFKWRVHIEEGTPVKFETRKLDQNRLTGRD
jgi:hypothetical protein